MYGGFGGFVGMFPTGVGMNRMFPEIMWILRDVPHRCGDEPRKGAKFFQDRVCSPQVWG